MGSVNYENEKIIFEGLISEDEVFNLKEYLLNIKADLLEFDFTNCKDIHTVLLQVILAYKSFNEVKFIFSDETTTYQKCLEGFFVIENNIN